MKYPAVEKTAVVTGATGGIGGATARLLRERGWRVWATSRTEEGAARLRGDGFEAGVLDLSDEASCAAAAASVLSWCGGRLGAVVDNAGYGQPGAVEDLSRAALRKQFETNVLGTVDFTNRLLPAMRAAGAGRVVVVSSVVGRIVMPILGAYGASKFALEALGDAWRMELRGGGISVSLVEPGPVATGFRRRCVSEASDGVEREKTAFAELYAKELTQPERTYTRPTDVFRKGPEAVAAKILHALESRRPKARYPVTGAAWLGDWAARFLPTRLRDRILVSGIIGRMGTAAGRDQGK